MSKIFLIKAIEKRPFSDGRLNSTLFSTAVEMLKTAHDVVTTEIHNGYVVEEEHDKLLSSDLIFFQYPMYWFSMPSTLKKYIDDVYTPGIVAKPAEKYGTGGLLKGKKYMISTTLNGPKSTFGGEEDPFYEGTLDDMIIPMHASQKYVGMTPLPTFAIYRAFETDIHKEIDNFKQHITKHMLD